MLSIKAITIPQGTAVDIRAVLCDWSGIIARRFRNLHSQEQATEYIQQLGRWGNNELQRIEGLAHGSPALPLTRIGMDSSVTPLVRNELGATIGEMGTEMAGLSNSAAVECFRTLNAWNASTQNEMEEAGATAAAGSNS